MKTKFTMILTLFMALIVQLTFAQEKTISGIVSDENGLPLIGTTVLIVGSSSGTTTDFDGKYAIKAKTGDVLSYSYVGYSTQNITVGASNTIDTSLQPDNTLDEVVITAQGIKREKKSLGYAVTTLKSEKIEQKSEGDIARVLNGKIAGVNITSSNGLSGSSTNIIIRGYSSVTQSNQPLFIVDGVPFDSGTNGQSNFLDGSTESSRFLDLDPNSIASVSVLKGLSATVLYGSRGGNGVILITTKNSGTKNSVKKTEVSINQSLFLSNAILPKYQDNYGGGFHQGFGFFFSNWGPRFDRTDDDGIGNAAQYTGNDSSNGNAILSHPFNYIGDQTLVSGFDDVRNQPYEYKPYNGVEEFFRTGVVKSTSINIKGGSDKTSFNANYGRLEDEGITPGNKLSRNTFSIGGSSVLSNKFTVSGVFNFSRTKYISPPNAASFGSGTGFDGAGVFGDLLYTPRSVDLSNIPFQALDGRSLYYRSGNDIQNPYWTVNNAFTTQNTDRFFGSTNLSYALNDWSNITYRLGLDSYTELNSYGQNRGGVDGEVTGIFRTISARNTIWDHSVIWNANKDLSDDLNLQVIAGINSRRDTYEQDGIESTGQLVFGTLKHFNFTTSSSKNSFRNADDNDIAFNSESNQVGIYASIDLGYKDYLFLNLAARNDWYSTLETENNSILYPGASVSFIPTSFAESIKGDVLNYLKIRAGYGTSAKAPLAFNTRNVLGINARDLVTTDGTVVSSNSVSNTLGNPDLKPEKISEIEFGIDSRLFNRLTLNLSVYEKTTQNLITNRTLDNATGFNNTLVNIGEMQSKGLEIEYDLNIIKPVENGFSFNLSGNFNANETTVTELAEGTDNIILTSSVIGEAANYAVEGEAFGVLLGTTILRNDQGEKVVGNNGQYLTNNTPTIIGDPNPDWTTSLIPNISYKGFRLSAQLQYRHGGDIYSTTAASLIGRGVVDADDPICRECNYILPGVKQDGTPNDIAITATNVGFQTYFGGPNELSIFDGSTIRLQEVSLSYNFSNAVLSKTPFGSLSMSISGNNLWYKALNFHGDLNYDTNASSTGVGNGQGIDFITGPSARRYGFSIKATF
jgi:TonB-linked SusC/RagA family outer membrane protein